MARILVTDAGRGSAIAIIRSLGKAGHEVIAADADRYSPGFYSRFANSRLRYPSPVAEPERFARTLLEAVSRRSVDLLVPVTEEVILPITRLRAEFERACRLALPSREALAVVSDKYATVELARRLGIPTPRTTLVSTAAEAVAQSSSLGWPIVIKPRFSRVYQDSGVVESFEVTYAESSADLKAKVAALVGRCPVLLQEYYPGEGHGVEAVLSGGRPVALFQHRRLREVPITGGVSSFRESVPLDPDLRQYAARLLGSLDWTGLAMVEYKLGQEGPRLMEVNGRIWGSLPLAVKSGVDFPAYTAEIFLNGVEGRRSPDASYRIGERSRNLELEVSWIASVLLRKKSLSFRPVPHRSEAARVALRLLSPADGFDVLSADDPRPGIAEIWKLGRKTVRKIARRG